MLKALAAECVKAIFFPIGKHATYYPEILRQVAAAGHTIGSHTWSHADLSRSKTPDEAKAEIEKAVSAVKWALEDQGQEAPFFRFPALRHPPEMVTYLGTRNIAIFSTDMDSFDFKMRKPEQVIKSVMAKLQKHGKGIVLMHDFQKATSEAVPQLARRAQGRRLQDRAHEAAHRCDVAAAVRRGAPQGRQAADRQPASGLERGPRRRIAISNSNARGGRKAAPLHLRARV